MRKGFWKGLRITEIGILLGLIIAIGIVVFFRYDRFLCRSMQSEAKFFLKEIAHAQKYYYEEFQAYAPIKELLQTRRAVIHQNYYDFLDDSTPTRSTFRIKAIGRKETLVDSDSWIIDQNGTLVNQSQKCLAY